MGKVADSPMEKPGPCVICGKPEGNIVSGTTDVDDITTDGVDIVGSGTSDASNDAESMSVQMHRMLRQASYVS